MYILEPMFGGIMKASKGFYSQKIILMPSLRSLLITFLIKTEKAAVLYCQGAVISILLLCVTASCAIYFVFTLFLK